MDTSDFPARWHCGAWTAGHGWLYILSDLAIFGAYVAIPCLLGWFLWRRKDLPFPRVGWLFVAFILACGATHLIDAIIFWEPVYRLSAVVRFFTGVVSWLTVAALVPAIPAAMALRSPDALQAEVEQRTAELAAERDANHQLAELIRSSHDVIISLDFDGVVRTWNPAAARLFGWTEDEMVGQSVNAIVPESERARMASDHAALRRGETIERYDGTRVHRDGSIIDVTVFSSPITNANGEVIGVSKIMRDITARKRAEDLFRLTFEAAPSAMLLVDDGGQIVLANDAGERLFRMPKGALVGSPVDALVPEHARAAHASFRAHYGEQPAARAMGEGRDLRARRGDGTEVPVEIGLNPVTMQGRRYVLAAVVDISARKQAELELREAHDSLERRVAKRTAQLTRSNDDLQRFAYVVSHDLQEPMRMVRSFSELVERNYTDVLDDKGRTYLGFVTKGADRMQGLLRDLLTYSRVGSEARPPVETDLNSVMDAVEANLRLVIDETGAEIVRTPDTWPTIHADYGQIVQLLQNLVGNALKFNGDAPPHVTVRVKRAGQDVLIEVEDKGIGFDPAHAARMFEMFQRLDPRGAVEGSGVGLAICRRIVHGHGGTVTAIGRPGKGACFQVRLPLDPSEAP